nr:hypothetical protein [uncultured bacterium]
MEVACFAFKPIRAPLPSESMVPKRPQPDQPPFGCKLGSPTSVKTKSCWWPFVEIPKSPGS